MDSCLKPNPLQNAKYMLQAFLREINSTCECNSKCPNVEHKCALSYDHTVSATNSVQIESCSCKCNCDQCEKCRLDDPDITDVGVFARSHCSDYYSQDDIDEKRDKSSYLLNHVVPHFACTLKYLKTSSGNSVRDVPLQPRKTGKKFDSICESFHRDIYGKDQVDTMNRMIEQCGWDFHAENYKKTVSKICPTATIPDKKKLISYKQVGLHFKNVCV